MTDSKTATELIIKLVFDLRRLEYEADKTGSDMTLGEYERKEAELIGECVQAVAATLGEQRDPTEDWLLSVCNQATQDSVAELESKLEAATQGSGECEVEETEWLSYGGEGCDTYRHTLSCGHVSETFDEEPPNYCPNCGKAVKR